jgi:hypothetical protein
MNLGYCPAEKEILEAGREIAALFCQSLRVGKIMGGILIETRKALGNEAVVKPEREERSVGTAHA